MAEPIQAMSPHSQEASIKINKAFKGKTIRKVEYGGVNAWMFFFSDGTQQEIIAENAINTSVGSIPGIFLNPAD